MLKMIAAFYLLVVFLAGIMSIVDMIKDDVDCLAVTPKQIYDCNNINMFGCIILFLLALFFNPVYFVIRLLYWIFHVGRRD